MANEQSPFKKRSNPFASVSGLGSINDIIDDVEEKKEKPAPKVEVKEVKPVEEAPVVVKEEVKVEPKVVENKVESKPRVAKTSTPKKAPVVVVSDDSKREKYTATMEKELRIRVKIASVRKGLQFSQYVEEAVLEKLEREGQ